MRPHAEDRAAPAPRWEGATAAEWRERWRLPRLLLFDTIGSTNDVVADLAAAGAPAGATVIAEHQSAGRGRLGRAWTAPPGRALLLSVLFRPRPVADPQAGTVPIRVGLAAARAVERAGGEPVRIKWPNDLVAADGAKLGGILCESRSPGTVVAGIGINVGQTRDELPAGATSLRLLGSRQPLPRAVLAEALIDALVPLFDAPASPLRPDELAEIARRDHLAGRAILLDGQPAGVAHGIAADGSLIAAADGTTRAIRAGTVRLAEPDPPTGERP